jgi:Uma2 family endonuclease
MSATKTLLTAEEFDNYPFDEDKRYELDEGELIVMSKPAYRHNRVLAKLYVELHLYFRKNGGGEALISENLYALSPKTRRSPDVGIILGDRHEELKSAKVIPIVPEIAVEVLSPSERPGMIHRKLKQYFDAGVKEVWLIDPESQDVEIWTGAKIPDHALAMGDALTSTLLPGFELPLTELFA